MSNLFFLNLKGWKVDRRNYEKQINIQSNFSLDSEGGVGSPKPKEILSDLGSMVFYMIKLT